MPGLPTDKGGRFRLLTILGILGITGSLALILCDQARRADEPDPRLASATAIAALESIRFPTAEEHQALQALTPLARRAFGPGAKAVYDPTPVLVPPFVVTVRSRAMMRACTIKALRVALKDLIRGDARETGQ